VNVSLGVLPSFDICRASGDDHAPAGAACTAAHRGPRDGDVFAVRCVHRTL